MQLHKHISELLYRYECVMVPNFGGFISNTIPSQVTDDHVFLPPSKLISFNVNLQQNDGLLVNHVANALDIGFDAAVSMIQKTVNNWETTLQTDALILNDIGKIFTKNNQLTFEPLAKKNYLTSSFGLSAVNPDYIFRENHATPVVANTAVKSYGKYIVSATVLIGLFFIGSTYYVHQQKDKQAFLAQQAITHQIQQASFNVLEPLPLVTLKVEQNRIEVTDEKNEQEVTGKYHIIAGAFKNPKNAIKKVALLKKKGLDASILGLNKWGLTQVSYASFDNKSDAIKSLRAIRKNDNRQAWLFVHH